MCRLEAPRLRIFFAQYAGERGEPDSMPVGRVDLVEIAPVEIGSRVRSYELVRSGAVISYMRIPKWAFDAAYEISPVPYQKGNRRTCALFSVFPLDWAFARAYGFRIAVFARPPYRRLQIFSAPAVEKGHLRDRRA